MPVEKYTERLLYIYLYDHSYFQILKFSFKSYMSFKCYLCYLLFKYTNIFTVQILIKNYLLRGLKWSHESWQVVLNNSQEAIQ